MKKAFLSTIVLFFVSMASFALENLNEQLNQLQTQIEELEKKCTPAVGSVEEDVEFFFGEGQLASNSKIPKKIIPADSPFRKYQLCKNGTLLVRYEHNRVKWAHYINPYSTKGIPKGKDVPVAQKIKEAKKRLSQMETILNEYLKKEKTISAE